MDPVRELVRAALIAWCMARKYQREYWGEEDPPEGDFDRAELNRVEATIHAAEEMLARQEKCPHAKERRSSIPTVGIPNKYCPECGALLGEG